MGLLCGTAFSGLLATVSDWLRSAVRRTLLMCRVRVILGLIVLGLVFCVFVALGHDFFRSRNALTCRAMVRAQVNPAIARRYGTRDDAVNALFRRAGLRHGLPARVGIVTQDVRRNARGRVAEILLGDDPVVIDDEGHHA
jgi:hypothetical protein